MRRPGDWRPPPVSLGQLRSKQWPTRSSTVFASSYTTPSLTRSSSKMSVALTPSNALGFNRPLTQHVKRSLAITNNNAQPVAFKVKTTAPKLYCVRPNSGRVEPGETVEVQVMLQAMKEEPPLNAKCKDKFLIQSTTITPEKESQSLQDIWTDTADEVHSQKIRVLYLPPEGQTVMEEEEVQPSQSSLLNVPADQYETVRQHPLGNGHAAESIRQHSGESGVPPHDQEEETHVDASSTPPADVAAHEDLHEASAPEVGIVNVNVHRAPSPPPPPPAPAPGPDPELIAQLHSAQAEIERLRNLISSMPDPSTAPTTITTSPTELRRRRPLSDDGSTYDGETEVGTYVDEALAQPEGVPLQVVIIIALGVFITTYLFF
ncbi:PapD-like protein [Amylocystis lapponica]|nr:PapD-like protein [Amylocystis lapponica]